MKKPWEERQVPDGRPAAAEPGLAVRHSQESLQTRRGRVSHHGGLHSRTPQVAAAHCPRGSMDTPVSCVDSTRKQGFPSLSLSCPVVK